MRKTLGLSILALLINGCSSSPGIPMSGSQSLVMEGAVLAAGIRASAPTLSQRDGVTVADTSLYNEQQHPVTLYYRFTGMTRKGLRSIRPIALER